MSVPDPPGLTTAPEATMSDPHSTCKHCGREVVWDERAGMYCHRSAGFHCHKIVKLDTYAQPIAEPPSVRLPDWYTDGESILDHAIKTFDDDGKVNSERQMHLVIDDPPRKS